MPASAGAGCGWGKALREMVSSRRVLLVEDEVMVAMLLEDLLADMGCTVVAVASQIDAAMTAARTLEYDLAILDVNLDGRETYPVADVVAARNLPSVFVTGYGPAGLRDAYRHLPVLTKPFREADLRKIVASALGAAAILPSG